MFAKLEAAWDKIDMWYAGLNRKQQGFIWCCVAFVFFVIGVAVGAHNFGVE